MKWATMQAGTLLTEEDRATEFEVHYKGRYHKNRTKKDQGWDSQSQIEIALASAQVHTLFLIIE